EILLWSYAIDDGPLKVYYPFFYQPFPDDLAEAILDEETIFVAHNASFERVLLTIVGARFLNPAIHAQIRRVDRWRCTAAMARSCGLPGALDNTAKALRMQVEKDREGYLLMMRMCKPLKFNVDGEPIWLEDEASILRLGQYCMVDTEVERDIDKALPDLAEPYQKLWELTEKINDRGILVDTKFLMRLMMLTEDASIEINNDIRRLSNGRINKITETAALTQWLTDMGLDVEESGIGAGVLADLLNDPELPDFFREVLTLRKNGGKSSTAKLKSLTKRSNSDKRIRGNLIFAGAFGSGRFCLAENTEILCKDTSGFIYTKPIQAVTIEDLVWDGDAWVEHEGVVFSGEKEVIQHDGILATREHEVFVSDEDKISLQMARDLQLKLYRGKKDPYDI
ncbi:MAG: hypothetical protein KGH75_10235, partial [Rhodospirillales bacterium]|nr:hypothetical protein [Rhodospirillales bacterium]